MSGGTHGRRQKQCKQVLTTVIGISPAFMPKISPLVETGAYELLVESILDI